MIPDNSKKKLEQLRQEMAFRAQLQQQYDKEMSGKYTRDMPSFQEWLDKRNKPMAKGGSTSPVETTVKLGGRDLPITMDTWDKRAGNKIVHVNPETFDKAFKKSKWQYVGEQGEGGIKDRYSKFADYAKSAKSVNASNADVSKEGVVTFGDGRHRYAYMRDQGVDKIPMSMDKKSIEHARQHGYLHEAEGGKVQAKRLYHGTNKDFKSFNVGSYLTDDPDYASKHGNIVMPVHMTASKIKTIPDEDFRLMASKPSALKPYIDDGYHALSSDAHGDYIVLDPSKVKSAITHKAEGGTVHPMGINVASDTKAGLSYADMIVDGHKKYESRNSDTLRPYVGKRVAIVRTGEGKAKAIGEVTIGEPKVVNQKQFRAMEDEHKVPKGSRFDINTPTKHLYPMHDPVRYEEERDVGHGIVSRQVIHKAEGGSVEDDYRSSHQAPGPHFGAPMHDVTREMYPKDFYSPNGLRYYADHTDPTDRDAYNKVTRVKGKPNEMVSIHRAIPTKVYNEALKKDAPLKHMIRKGDWVAINKDYAKDHGESVLLGDYKIASMRVPAKHVWTNADSIHEWGYHPDEKATGGIIRKARGGTVQPTLDEMRLALAKGGKVEVRATVKDEALMRKIPQMEEAARKVSEGKMSHSAYDKVVAKHKPVKPYEFVPKPASDEDAHRALRENKKPHWRGAESWPAGRKVGLRLDIPSYEDHGVWVNSIHDEEGKGDNKLKTSYGPVSSVKNATFDAGPHHAIKVATGEQNKSPFARIKGSLHHMTEDEAVEHMQKNLNHPDYAQVGMDPRRHGYFYDRKTLQPVTHAKHVVQIGPLVLAHKPTYGERDTYAHGGVIHKAEGGKVEPTPDQMREALLKSRRNGMYSPLEKLAIDIPRNKGTGAEFMAEISKQKGFKPEELADRKIPIPEGKMTKLEFLKHLRQHSLPPLQEQVLHDLGNENEARDDRAQDYYGAGYDEISPEQRIQVKDWVRQNAAKYQQYQLPNGENYREMLLKLPALSPLKFRTLSYLQSEKRRTDPQTWANSPDSKRLDALMEEANKYPIEYNSNHWRDHPNTLAHVRLSDREGPNGEKLLHLEELQSDWHQQGRKVGYARPREEVLKEMREEHERLLQEHETQLKEKRNALFNEFKSIKNQLRSMPIGASDLATQLRARELDIAKEFKALDEVQPPEPPKVRDNGVPQAPFKKSWHELGMKHVLHHAAKNGYDGVVITPGDEQADRWRDEGLKVHYDKKIPEFLNKFGKPFGTQVGTFPLETQGEARGPIESVQAIQEAGISMDDYLRMLPEQRAKFDYKTKQIPLHYFPINDQMRTSILKEGMPQYMRGGVVHKAEGGAVLPIEKIKADMMSRFKGLSNLQSIGADEAPSLGVKAYVPTVGRPDNGQMPVGGVDTSSGSLPVGGIDMSKMQAGNQLMPNVPSGMPQGMDQPPMGDRPPMGGMPPPQGGSNILSMTPQGQAMAAMKPQGLAEGGSAKSTADMKAELAAKKSIKDGTSTRIKIDAEGPGGVKGIVVPRHMWEGKTYKGEDGKKVEGMRDVNEARAKVYGSENRDPLTSGQMNSLHKKVLAEHFQKPLEEQTKAEEEALNRLREAKHIGKTANTLDKSEKLDTVNHETDSAGRNYVGFASKGVAGHSLYTSGHGKNQKHHVINTCAGQTVGCGGGTDKNGIVDTSRGTCFAPNAESQYVNAAVRRASHEQAKHDPAMSKDWILAHTGSLRNAAENADKKNKVLLFRPNVVDETDVTSRHAIRHLNDQRKANGKPHIIANSYGKTNELHDPENGYYVTHSNVGPKVKKGQEIAENIARDKARVRNTVLAADNKGDFKNEQGNKTPPKGSYMVTDVKRGSPLSKNMEAHITHAKYWTTGRPHSELTPEEIAQGPEGHFGGDHKPTTEDEAHYGHKTVKGLRFDYQKQHILHPRLVQVGKNDDGTPHMIPTDSRFKDEEVLNKQVKERYKTKNGKVAGHILMTTPTESTSSIGHQTSFTHHVNDSHIEHAKKNKGEYEIDKPEDQLKASGKEYVAPQAIKFYAEGGTVGGRHIGFSDDDFHAFPEQNVVAQRHLAMRGHDKEAVTKHSLSDTKRKVTMNKDMDTMLLELTRNKKAK